MNIILSGFREILSRAIREDIQLTITPAPEHATVLVAPDDLEQVILNLVINARDALENGGHIWIDVCRMELEAGALPDPSLAPGSHIRLTVRDDGVGMPAEVLAHLFEPFFTTKEVGKGTGLGLAFVYGTVRQHHGAVTVESAPGAGTTFALYFPLQPQAPRAAELPAPLPPAAPRVRRASTILLVEDEDAVRAVTASTLRRAGHRVLEAALPSAAIVLFDEHAADIDLLLTDVVMPEMHGPQLAERLVQRRPGLRVLFVSGYSDVFPAVTSGSTSVSVLSKPFAPANLVATVDDLLRA